ncbi:hypothetical protein D3C75_1301160 [compost metagenome]
MSWLLSRFKWYRRLRGGRWECWYMDEVYGGVWFHNPVGYPKRPHGMCRGTPTIEVYP